jgi:cytochrome c553
MGSQHRRRLIAVGGILAVGAVAAIVVVLTGSGSSDSSGTGPTGVYSIRMSDNVPRWIREERLPPAAVPGAKIFALAGCTTCHTYAGNGSSQLHAPDLTAIGSRRLGLTFEIRKLRCPSCTNPDTPMPGFASLGTRRLRQLAVFLEASKGVR